MSVPDRTAEERRRQASRLADSLRDIKSRMMVKTANARRTKLDLEVMIALQMAADALDHFLARKEPT